MTFEVIEMSEKVRVQVGFQLHVKTIICASCRFCHWISKKQYYLCHLKAEEVFPYEICKYHELKPELEKDMS